MIYYKLKAILAADTSNLNLIC